MISGPSITVPTANIAVNKSRIKLYNKQGELPVYYLQSGQEFQIELFNPTSDVVLAKITLNNKLISQGGLVLNPGERVFLDRYLDVAKKFLFDTYEVSNTTEVKKAIENNGDIKVEFFKERSYYNISTLTTLTKTYGGSFGGPTWVNTSGNGTFLNNASFTTSSIGNSTLTSSVSSSNNITLTNLSTCDSLSLGDVEIRSEPINDKKGFRGILRSKNIETGRVEQGSHSDQKFKTVDKNFEFFPFHTIEYKLLPISQKINTSNDLKVKLYCTNCGTKLGKGHKFCSSCGTKA